MNGSQCAAARLKPTNTELSILSNDHSLKEYTKFSEQCIEQAEDRLSIDRPQYFRYAFFARAQTLNVSRTRVSDETPDLECFRAARVRFLPLYLRSERESRRISSHRIVVKRAECEKMASALHAKEAR